MTVCSGRILVDSALRGVLRSGGGGATTAGTGDDAIAGADAFRDRRRGKGSSSLSRPQKVDVVAESDDKPCPQICPELPNSDRTERTSEHLTAPNTPHSRPFLGTSNPRAEVRLLRGPSADLAGNR